MTAIARRAKRVFWILAVPQVVFLAFAFGIPNNFLIGVLHIANFALACCVVVAYFPVVLDVILSDRVVDRADWLGIGVFLSWLSTILLRAYSLTWRWMGQPDWLTQSDILSYALFAQFCAAIFHLAAPGAIDNRVPTRRWINIGLMVGVFVFLALVLGYFFDALAVEL